MNDLIDISSYPNNLSKTYEGANGKKVCYIINGEDYMVKFPSDINRRSDLSYANNCISEYIGCHIFELAEIPVQKTFLAKYSGKDGKQKIVVACKDFTEPGEALLSFTGIKNQIIESSGSGRGTELSEILETFSRQNIFDENILVERFWDMFIVDSLIGNFDRHNGNWGYLRNTLTGNVKLAPVYDCASSLFPQADEEQMKSVLSNPQELKLRIYERPLSAIKNNDKKLNYKEFINSLSNEDCNRSLKKIYPKLVPEKIHSIIDDINFISDIQKNFYKTILDNRLSIILSQSYKKLLKKEHNISKINNEKLTKADDYGYSR